VFGAARGIYMVVTVIGPALAGWLAYRLDFRPMLVVAFCFYAAATAVRLWMATAERFAPKRAAEKPTFSGLKTQMGAMFGLLFAGGILTWIWITDAVNDTSSSLIGQLLPLYLSEVGRLNVALIGAVNAAWGLASILGSFLGGWLTDKRSERTIISTGFLLVALALAGIIASRSLVGFVAAMSLHGFGVGILMPAYDALISKVVPEDKRGLAFGFFGTSLGILSLPMPWIGAQLWERFGPPTPFWVTVAACSISIPIVWFKFLLPKKENIHTTENGPA
jgi:MFS family permease